jgi:tight adherence protein B
MTIFLFSYIVFVAVVLILSLLYWVWINFFSPNNKAKKERLQTIQNAVHSSDPSLSSTLSPLPGNEIETWLRSRSRTFVRLESLIKHAHSSFTAGHLMGLMLILFIVALAFGLLRQANPWLTLVLATAAAGMPVLWLSRKASKRGKAFGDKLPETLNYISRALRASHSLNSAISMVGKEFPDPIGTEFKTVSDKIGFGIPFKDALGQLAEGIQSNDLNFFVVSLLIQHETGGNLTELLDDLANTIRERIKLRGKIRTLSSEGRASAWVLGSLPFAIAGILTLSNPEYISILWTTPQGRNLILIGFALMVVGLLVLKRIVQIKV